MTLTKREFEVVKLLSLGFIAKEIGNSLFLSKRTVESHKENVFKKNESVRNIADLVREFVLNFGDPKTAIFYNLIIIINFYTVI